MKASKEKKAPDFSMEKFEKVVKKIESISDKTETTYNDIKEKSAVYLKSFVDNLVNVSTENRKKAYFQFLLLPKNFYIKYGEEFFEKFFCLYDNKEFNFENNSNNKTLYEYFVHLFFLNSDLLKKFIDIKIISYDIDKKVIIINESNLQTIKIEDFNISNNLIDLILLKIFSYSKIQTIYTTFTGLLFSVTNNIIKFYKLLSLFALCFWQLKNKENFLTGLLYFFGGVMRDLGRSYLKTKGIYNENLSYHKCPKGNKNHETQFCKAKILLEKDCDNIKDYFLPSIQKFLEMSLIDNNYDNTKYWDDFTGSLSCYEQKNYQDGEYKESDLDASINETIPPKVKCFHIILLFLSDFIFFFISNFCKFEYIDTIHNLQFQCEFEGFKEFINFALKIIVKNNKNILNLWNFSSSYKRFLQIECEKTEYLLSDKFNHYGISFIFIIMLTKQFDHNNLLPLITNKSEFKNLYSDIVYFILNTENKEEDKYTPHYEELCYQFCKSLKCHNLFLKDNENKFNELIEEFKKAKIDAQKINQL